MGKGSARTARTRDEYDATRGALKNAKAAEHDVSKNKNVDSAALDAPTPPNVVGAKHKPRTTPPPSPASDRFPLQNLRNASFPEGGQDGNRRSSSDDDNHAGISSDDYAAAVDDTPGPPATLHMEYWMRSEVRLLLRALVPLFDQWLTDLRSSFFLDFFRHPRHSQSWYASTSYTHPLCCPPFF